MPRKKVKQTLRLPLIPLRGLMVFPHMVLHFDVGRVKSTAALEKAMVEDQKVFLVAQRDGNVEDPGLEDLCRVGTVALVKQVLNLPGDAIRVLVEGESRAMIQSVIQEEPCWIADVTVPSQELPDSPEVQAWFDRYGPDASLWPEDAQAEFARRYEGRVRAGGE